MIGSGCVILGVHTAHEKQVDGVILYESASAIKGLKPHQICQISNNIGRPTARAFTHRDHSKHCARDKSICSQYLC